jgi:saccharopine dehydrogenase-like NADP-dependent oxidoreductase
MLIELLEQKLPLGDGVRDMVALVHELEVVYPENGLRQPHRITSTLVAESDRTGLTAMSRSVGLPTAIAVKRLLRGELPLTGSVIPTHPSIYAPVLEELAGRGLAFREKSEALL